MLIFIGLVLNVFGPRLLARRRSCSGALMPLRDIALALVVVTIWGINFTVIKMSVTELPPLLAASLRFFFAAVPAVFFVRRPQAPWRLVIGYGLCMGVALYSLLNMSIFLGMPASLSSLVLQVQAMFTILLAFFFLGERPRGLQLFGIGVAFAGICLIGLAGLEGVGILPFLITIAAAMAWGVANILSKKAGNIDMIGFTVWGNLVAPVPLLVLSLLIDGPEAVIAALSHPSWQVAGSSRSWPIPPLCSALPPGAGCSSAIPPLRWRRSPCWCRSWAWRRG